MSKTKRQNNVRPRHSSASRCRLGSADVIIGAETAPGDIEISDELRHTLDEAVREAERLNVLNVNAVPYEMVGPRTFTWVKDEPVVIVRQQDSHGRRHSNFCHLQVSPGLDAVAFAREIAEALQKAGPSVSAEPAQTTHLNMEIAQRKFHGGKAKW